MWTDIHACERWMEEAALKYAGSSDLKPLLDQAARELMLLESSDWEFLITTFQAKEYGIKRFRDHLERFRALQAAVEGRGTVNLEELMEQDRLFKDLDFAIYRPI
jgi:1,4-alpha-glucan branching enzyme